MYPRELSLTRDVINLMKPKDPRFGLVMASMIRHLHDFVREVELTEQEWLDVLQFLRDAGDITTDKRQEFILLSDILGVSTLVDDLNDRLPQGASERTVLGPFYWPGAPELPMGSDLTQGLAGEPCFYRGRLTSMDGRPIEGATLDIWSGDGEGFYDMQLDTDEMRGRGKLKTGPDGRYWFRSIKPMFYPIPSDGPAGALLKAMGRLPNRPAHVHAIISAQGYRSITTHIFASDSPYLDCDAVFSVKPGLIAEFQRHEPGKAPTGEKMDVPFFTCEFDFRLAPVLETEARAA